MLNMRNQVNTPNQTGTADSSTCQSDSTVLRKENQDEHNHTKMVFDRLEQTVSVIKNQLTEHGKRFGSLEDRVSTAEDTGTCCTMIQIMMISRNIRIFQIPEGSEGRDMVGFVKGLLHKELKLPPDTDIRIERAHRSLVAKPTDLTIVRFLDAAVKTLSYNRHGARGQFSSKASRSTLNKITLLIYSRNG